MGYSIAADFNGLSVWANKSDHQRCEECDRILDDAGAQYACSDKPKLALDLSQSSDGIYVGSLRFKSMYDREGLTGLTFTELESGFFALGIVRRVNFDLGKVRTLREGLCDTCGFYRKVAVAPDPIVLAPGEMPIEPNEFVASALEWGDALGRWRDLLCGNDAYNAMKFNNIRKVYFRKMAEIH